MTALLTLLQLEFQSERIPPEGRVLASRVFEKLSVYVDDQSRAPNDFPARQWLHFALGEAAKINANCQKIASHIQQIENKIGWFRRTAGSGGSSNYVAEHAHGIICGPGGLESRHDVQLGFSIMGPNILYPTHSHPPEEVYLLLSEGEFSQEHGEFINPGIRGGIHNRPNAIHTMRSLNSPLLAFWCLELSGSM